MQLYEHQKRVLDQSKNYNRVGYYLDMGLGKTFVGSEKMMSLGSNVNLVICQKSKVQDWCEHLEYYYSSHSVYDLTNKKEFEEFMTCKMYECATGIINYELAWRRPDLLKLKNFTLMLDESSLISNEHSKRSRFILKLPVKNVILLSGTPTNGKYEQLWSQLRLLGWNIPKTQFYNSYVIYDLVDFYGFKQKVIRGYKNIDHLKKRLEEFGCIFMKTNEVMDLPDQVTQKVYINPTSDYKNFRKNDYIELPDGTELIGDNVLTKMLYERQLCGYYNSEKLSAFSDLLDSTADRLIVFYNFNKELEELTKIVESKNRPISIINGSTKDLTNYETFEDSVTLIQYQSGAMGLNLQKSNHLIYFTLPLGKGSCGLWEQSKKRIHRIGQNKTCFYYYLLVKNSIEISNLKCLQEGKDLTDDLFIRLGENYGR